MLHKKQAVQYVNQLTMISIVALNINKAKLEYKKYCGYARNCYDEHPNPYATDVNYWSLKLRLLKIAYKMLQRGATHLSLNQFDNFIVVPSKNAMILHDGKLRDTDTIILAVEKHLKHKQAAKNA